MTTPPRTALALTDAQLTSLMSLSRPLQPYQRIAFFEMVAERLAGRSTIGDGELHRLCRDLQREVFSPPERGQGAFAKYR